MHNIRATNRIHRQVLYWTLDMARLDKQIILVNDDIVINNPEAENGILKIYGSD